MTHASEIDDIILSLQRVRNQMTIDTHDIKPLIVKRGSDVNADDHEDIIGKINELVVAINALRTNDGRRKD